MTWPIPFNYRPPLCTTVKASPSRGNSIPVVDIPVSPRNIGGVPTYPQPQQIAKCSRRDSGELVGIVLTHIIAPQQNHKRQPNPNKLANHASKIWQFVWGCGYLGTPREHTAKEVACELRQATRKLLQEFRPQSKRVCKRMHACKRMHTHIAVVTAMLYME